MLIIFNSLPAKSITVMLDPAGDCAGRLIEDVPERGLTMVLAQAIKSALEAAMPNVRVVLTRTPTEVLEPLQNSAFANRLNVEYYIRLQLIDQPQGASQLYCYHVLYDPVTDFWEKTHNPLAWYDFTQSYLFSILTTQKNGLHLVEELKKNSTLYNYQCNELIGLPCKPLLGIIAPTALMLEIGLKNKNDWQRFVEPLTMGLKNLLEKN